MYKKLRHNKSLNKIPRYFIHNHVIQKVTEGYHSRVTLLVRVLLLLFCLTGAFALQPEVVNAEAATSLSNQVEVTQQGQDTYIRWSSSEVSAASLMQNMETVRFGGYNLPMQLVTIEIPHEESIQVTAEQLQNGTWSGTLQEAEALTPTTDENWNEYPELLPERELALPNAPVFVLREGRYRDARVAVVAFSPIYQEKGNVMVASDGQVKIANTTPSSSSQIQAASANRSSVTSITSVPPQNALAAQNSIKIQVSDKGIQNVTGEMLAEAGLDMPEASKLHLRYKGQSIPIEVRDADNNDVIDTDDSIRFYSGEIGDYWNQENVYWLSVETSDGPQMETYSTSIGTAANRTTAMEKGVWLDNLDYKSLIPGADDDHWFALDMKAEPSQQGNPERYSRLEANVGTNLPAASTGSSTFTLIGSAYTAAEYTFEINMGTDSQEKTWDSRDNVLPTEKFQRNWEHTITTNAKPTDMEIVLLPDDASAGLVFDKIEWEQPVILNFLSRGGFFSGVSGTWNYELSNIPTNHAVYQITDPMAPQIIPTSSGSTASFVDDVVNDYVIAGSGTLHEPEVTAHDAVAFSSSEGTDGIYITPAGFIDEVQRLANHRSSVAGGNFQTSVVDIQDIYDAWSYGHVEPEAIRSFLRFAVANWTPTPTSVVFVGDTTRDPKNYQGKNNTNYIPPYLRNIDPWIGETACERCYVQLHGDDPLNTADDPDFIPDIQLGRLPVNNLGDMKAVVDKIIQYETADDTDAPWRGVSLFLADNYVERMTNGRPFTDSAGDFAKFSDDIVKIHPRDIDTNRIYYDPYPSVGDPNGVEPWRETDAAKVRLDAIEAMTAGAGLVSYNGHSNHWQWATTDLRLPEPRILNISDVNLVQNHDKYFINLSMTCYTSQFQKPAQSGTTLDERLMVRSNGGAVATWGSSGLSVAHGHDALQRGFHSALWNGDPMSTRIGDLLEAGYDELFETGGSCCQDARHTFLLMGDPLMRVRVGNEDPLWPEIEASISAAILESETKLYLPVIYRN